MLELLTPPDHDVAAILQAALEYAHLSIPSPRFWSRTTFLKQHFTRHIAKRAIQDLLAASKRPESYELANAHWLLLHDVLDLYCEDHNASPEVDPEADPWPAGDPDSRPIPFDAIRSEYFGHPRALRDGSHVSAKDLGTGKEQKITITASSGLSKDEIEKMRKDAESHADEDRQQREAIEARNEADNAVYRSEKMLKDNADKIPASEKSKIESAITAVKDALKGSDAAAIKSASEKLNEAWQAVSAELYKAASEKARASKAPPGGEPKGDAGRPEPGQKDEGPIIDAEVVDEKK